MNAGDLATEHNDNEGALREYSARREMLKSASTSFVRRFTSSSMLPIVSWYAAAVRLFCRLTSPTLRIAARGVRNSCDALAIKCCSRREAASSRASKLSKVSASWPTSSSEAGIPILPMGSSALMR